MNSNYTLTINEYIEQRYGYNYTENYKMSVNNPGQVGDEDHDEELYELLKAYKEYADWKELMDMIDEITEKKPQVEQLL